MENASHGIVIALVTRIFNRLRVPWRLLSSVPYAMLYAMLYAMPHAISRTMSRSRLLPRKVPAPLLVLLLLIPALSNGQTDEYVENGLPSMPPADAEYTTFALDSRTMMVGEVREHQVAERETLFQIARHYNLGFRELIAANPNIDPWVPEPGLVLTIPGRFVLPAAPREGVVVNLAQRRLFYFPAGGDKVLSWPVSIGQQGHDTPLGQTRIERKRKHPTWIPPRSVREKFDDLPDSMPPGPNNPLGTRALDLGWPAYVIHGSNLAMGVGASLSHGCVRMYNRDVEELYEMVATGTLVTVVEQPVRFARQGNHLYMQVSPDWDKIDSRGRVADSTSPDRPLAMQTLLDHSGEAASRLDWETISATLMDARGGTVMLGELDLQ